MPFDARTEKNIATLLPAAQEQARQFMQRVLDAGIDARIISGTRTFKEQDALFAKGRTKPGPKVTNARGGFSNHNFGVAWDIGIFDGSRYLPESSLYARAGQIGREMGLEWGGDWQSIKDEPHFQCRTGLTTRQMREMVLAGKGEEIPILPLKSDHAPTTEEPDAVEVYLKTKKLEEVPALLIDSRVYVGIRKFVEELGGAVIDAGGNPFQATVAFHEKTLLLNGRILDGAGYVKFADVNQILGYSYAFDSKKKRLTLSL